MSSSFITSLNSDGTYSIGFINGQIGFVNGKEYVRQRITTRLQFYLGEWFLDTSQGVPWFEDVFVKPVNLVLVESIIKTTILETPDVTSLSSFDADYDATNRLLNISFRVNTIYGEVDIPYVITPPFLKRTTQ